MHHFVPQDVTGKSYGNLGIFLVLAIFGLLLMAIWRDEQQTWDLPQLPMDDSSSTVPSHPGYYLQGFYTSQWCRISSVNSM